MHQDAYDDGPPDGSTDADGPDAPDGPAAYGPAAYDGPGTDQRDGPTDERSADDAAVPSLVYVCNSTI